MASQIEQIDYFELRGSVYLLVSAIATSLEIFLGRAIPNSMYKTMVWKDNITLQEAIDNWLPIIEKSIPFVSVLSEAIVEGKLSKELVDKGISTFRSLLYSTKGANEATFEEFANLVDFI